jgi:dipeptidyl aminopeptidase/acylaminoacyl peptidase
MRNIILLGVAVWAAASLTAAERLPIEDFAHQAAFVGMTLSPDGKTVAYVQNLKGAQEIVLRDLDTDKVVRIEMPASRVPWVPQSTRIGWANSRRLVFGLGDGGFSAVDCDGTRIVGLTGANREKGQRIEGEIRSSGVLHFLRSDSDGAAMMTEYTAPAARYDGEWYAPDFPHVIRMNTRSGAWSRVEQNPGNVEGWLADSAGVIRVALESKGGIARTVYRESAKAPWAALPGMDWNDTVVRPLGLGADGTTLYVNRKSSAGRWAVYPYDLVRHTFGEAVIEHGLFDIIPNGWLAHANGVPLQTLVFAPDRPGELLGVRFLTEFPRTVWFDAALEQVQGALDAALPRKINTVVSLSDDRQRMIVQSWSAGDPGTFYLFDAKTQKLAKLLDRMPWITAAKMAETTAVRFKARDGEAIQGYLTLPPGREGKNLPLMVLVHGGPQTRDVWGYDPDVQFLANRGYAVLQVNYRGSIGFGDAFLKLGRRQVGAATQQDITDGARWLIKQGIADAQRVGIMGGSFGGYSALMGLAQEPGLYRCGVSIAGVTDWVELIKTKAAMFPRSYGFNVGLVGDPVKDAAALREISPVHLADRMTAPLLLIHGRDDPAVPFPQAQAMVAALEKAARPPEFMSKYNEQHGLLNYGNRVEMYRRLDQFLQKHLPAN